MVERVVERPVAKKNDAVTSYIAGENPEARRIALVEVWDILHAATHPLTDTELHDANKERFDAGMSPRRWTRQRLGTAAVDLRDIYKVVRNGPGRDGGSPTGGQAQTWIARRPNEIAVVVPFYRDDQYDACWAIASEEASILASKDGFAGVRYQSDELADPDSVGLAASTPAGMRFRRFYFEAVAA